MHPSIRVKWVLCAIAVLALITLVTALPGIAQSTVRPAITRDIDNGDRQEIYARSASIVIPDGRVSEYWCGDPVPAGKRLIIEQLAAKATHDSVDDILVVFRGREVAGGDRDLAYLPLAPSARTTGGTYHVANLPVEFRLGPGMTPCFIAMRTHVWTGAMSVSLTQSGYFVEAP